MGAALHLAVYQTGPAPQTTAPCKSSMGPSDFLWEHFLPQKQGLTPIQRWHFLHPSGNDFSLPNPEQCIFPQSLGITFCSFNSPYPHDSSSCFLQNRSSKQGNFFPSSLDTIQTPEIISLPHLIYLIVLLLYLEPGDWVIFRGNSTILTCTRGIISTILPILCYLNLEFLCCVIEPQVTVFETHHLITKPKSQH